MFVDRLIVSIVSFKEETKIENIFWTDTQQYLAQAEYGVCAWSVDVEMSIGGLPRHGKLPHLANGYSRELRYQRATHRLGENLEAHAFAKTFSEATARGKDTEHISEEVDKILYGE